MNIDEEQKELHRIIKESNERQNIKSQHRLENNYVEIKNLAIMLIDFIPYNKKEQMIKKLQDFLGEQNESFINDNKLTSLHDAKIEGIYSSGPIGIVYNADIKNDGWEDSKRELPKPFSSIHVYLGQLVNLDFFYYVIFHCNIKEDYLKKGIKESYIHTDDFVYNEESKSSRRRGPELEPNIRQYQQEIEEYLKDFSCGLFLNTFRKSASCPNIKILSIKNIDFKNFNDWEINHRKLLSFLGYKYSYSQLNDNYLVGFSADELFQKKGYTSGFIFLASENNFNYDGYLELDSGIVFKLSSFIKHSIELQSYLFTYYWMAYQLEINILKWDEDINIALNDLKTKDDLDDIIEAHKKMVEQKSIFDEYYNEELSNNKQMEKSIDRFDITSMVNPLPTNKQLRNVFEFLTTYSKHYPNQEKDELREIKSKFETFFSYSNNVTNITLNKSNNKLQRIALYIAIISIVISAIGILFSSYLALSDYQTTHPKGKYFISVYKIGYDRVTNMERYRIQFTYYGRGESKYLSIKIGIVGVNPTILSKGNCEVMEPYLILVRDYVDGLTGWVDYGIARSASIDTEVNILDTSSDVDVKIS